MKISQEWLHSQKAFQRRVKTEGNIFDSIHQHSYWSMDSLHLKNPSLLFSVNIYLRDYISKWIINNNSIRWSIRRMQRWQILRFIKVKLVNNYWNRRNITVRTKLPAMMCSWRTIKLKNLYANRMNAWVIQLSFICIFLI